MNKSWGEIFPGLDEPVQGLVSSYDSAEGECDKLKQAAEVCADEFDRVTSSDSLGELGGLAADQLIALINEVDGAFQDLPPVFATLASIFDEHEQKLTALRQEAALALALANTRWNALQEANASHADANAALHRINSQIRSLERNAGDDLALHSHLNDLYGDRTWRNRVAASCATAVADAERELGWSHDAHGVLVESEQGLAEATAGRVKGLDLDDLKDPNRLMQLATGVGEFFSDLVENIVVGVADLVQALASGDWMDAVWRLSELLDAVLDVLTLVALVVAVVTTGGVLGVVLVGLSLAAMATKLTADALLAGTQHPHPTTGQPKTWGEVAVDAALIFATAATFELGGIGARALRPSAQSRAADRSVVGNSGNALRQLPPPAAGACTGPLRWRVCRVAETCRSIRDR